ncbi:MAG: mechanosensitive ion channel family protein [Roseburia sp.]
MDENATEVAEVVEALNNAQQELQEVAKNPGLLRTWLEGLIPDLLNFALQVVIAIVIYIIGGKIIRAIVKMVRRSLDRAGTDEGVKQFVTPLVKYGLYVVLIFLIMGLFGIATTSAVAVLGSAGVAIGLALQGSLSNFAGGILILLLKPFRVGDYIVVNGSEGIVAEISVFYTRILAPDNKMTVIPNGTLSNSSLTNVSHMDRRRVDILVGISYEADIRTAKEILRKLAEEDAARLPEEEPVVFVDELGDSAVVLGVRVWVAAEDYWDAKWRLTENIKYALDEHGISIPYHQLDVQIKQ